MPLQTSCQGCPHAFFLAPDKKVRKSPPLYNGPHYKEASSISPVGRGCWFMGQRSLAEIKIAKGAKEVLSHLRHLFPRHFLSFHGKFLFPKWDKLGEKRAFWKIPFKGRQKERVGGRIFRECGIDFPQPVSQNVEMKSLAGWPPMKVFEIFFRGLI